MNRLQAAGRRVLGVGQCCPPGRTPSDSAVCLPAWLLLLAARLLVCVSPFPLSLSLLITSFRKRESASERLRGKETGGGTHCPCARRVGRMPEAGRGVLGGGFLLAGALLIPAVCLPACLLVCFPCLFACLIFSLLSLFQKDRNWESKAAELLQYSANTPKRLCESPQGFAKKVAEISQASCMSSPRIAQGSCSIMPSKSLPAPCKFSS